ncbi:MAG: hypothetical protein E7380_02985 [Clostridiales bacterium]|nr:hypothetical protein [Clostridiales bacterium]
MRLYDEIFKNADGVFVPKCCFVPEGGGYFEGVKTLGELSSDRIVLYFPRTQIIVEGRGLSVKKYCDGDLEIAGKIVCVRAETDEKGRA